MTTCIDKLDDIEDSKMLGDLMTANGLTLKMKQVLGNEMDIGVGDACCGGGGPSKKPQKWPELVEKDCCSSFNDNGTYMIIEDEVNTRLATFYFVGGLLLIFGLISMSVWPR